MLRLAGEFEGNLINADLITRDKWVISEIECYYVRFNPPVELGGGMKSLSPMNFYVRSDAVFWPNGSPVDADNPAWIPPT